MESRPRTLEQLLDREEALALQRISESVKRLGEGLCTATNLRGTIRRHPLLATGLGACLGFAGGPLLRRTLARALSATAKLPIRRGLPGAVLASLRKARGLG
jgi:hypothetical protein